ncbi:MAG: hypothetical protein J6B85_08535 [Lachnospiraceae bacterium]|nr:hypothetical protein [Lachnospiraceae bacterium]
MAAITNLKIMPVSMVTQDQLQRIEIVYECDRAMHVWLSVFQKEKAVAERYPLAFDSGSGRTAALLPVPEEELDTLWCLTDREGNVLAEVRNVWRRPREWTLYVMVSSHTDIGLHNSQYIQRYNSSRFTDLAMRLCDETGERPEENRYRYTMEGTWFWNNYGMDRGREKAEEIVRDYIKPGKIGVCCGVAGNHTQVYGLEEMCRSAYEKKRLGEDWDITGETMSMIDNNGLSMAMIQPYVEAGYKNIIFAPNQWNPLPSSIWKMDHSQKGSLWSPNANGGGARIDIRYDSELPMVFFWEDADGNRLLVWGSAQYDWGGEAFGLSPGGGNRWNAIPYMEDCVAKQLPLMEGKYPYDIWLFACYADDQEPGLNLTDTLQSWNTKWKWPKFRTLGNPDIPFNQLRERYYDQIPVRKGDITGGWYQHPLTTPELLAQKFAADRLLPTAEKWSTVAAILDGGYEYPAGEFRRAWDYLLYNDEHSYGTSGYQGRRVYETWMQHRDWIDKAARVAEEENAAALRAIADKIAPEGGKRIVFNPTALARQELVKSEDGEVCALVKVPAFGYRTVEEAEFFPCGKATERTELPPVVENRYYRVTFAENGSLRSIFDKEQNRELLDCGNAYHANELVYTKDNHRNFHVPEKAVFEVTKEAECITVTARMREEKLGAELVQSVALPSFDKRIDIDNRLYHVKDMVNQNRYYRYLYYAFPFAVDHYRRYCHLNGAAAEYAKDVTGHGTDVYMAVNEWCCAENEEYGVALMMLDSQLMEFDHIHPDKTDFGDAGEGSQMFAYVANDWLQMHTPGGSHLNYRFRYSITSYQGDHETAGIPQAAERYANPVQVIWVPKKKEGQKQDPCSLSGKDSHSFLSTDAGTRLICLKRADDGNGVIARLYGEGGENAAFSYGFGTDLSAERVRIDESPMQNGRAAQGGDLDAGVKQGKGFFTYRLGSGTIRLKERPLADIRGENGAPAPVGSVYTGLITEPRAARGEHAGHLYLLWGRSMEEDFSHYKLYRSERPDFEANEDTFLAEVKQEEYRVGRYEDTGLKEHTCYYYRVCAVNRNGQCGPMSQVFCGITKESLESEE